MTLKMNTSPKIVRQNNILIIAAVIILVYLTLQDIFSSTSIYVMGDEFGYWGVAAQLAGFDWTETLGTVYYYSYGYSFFLIPILLITKDPTLRYQVAICLNAVMYVSAFLLARYCGKRLFPKIDSRIITICSFVVLLYPSTVFQIKIAWSETLLLLLFFAQAAALISLLKKASTVRICLFTALGVYTYMVHQRMLGVLVATLLFLIILVGLKRIKPMHFIVAIAVFAALFGCHSMIKSYLMDTVWTPAAEFAAVQHAIALNEQEVETLSVGNDYASSFAKVINLFINGSWIELLQEAAGQSFALLVGSFGMMYMGLVFIFQKIFPTKSEIKSGRAQLLSIYLLMCLVFTFGISCLAMYGYGQRIDTLVYSRYMDNCVPFIMLLGMLWIVQNISRTKEFITVYLVGVLLIVTLGFVADDACTNYFGNQFNYLCSVALAYFNANEYTFVATGIIAVAIFSIYVVYLYATSKKSRISGFFIGTTALCIVLLCVSNYNTVRLQRERDNGFSTEQIAKTQTLLAGYDELYWYVDYSDTGTEKRMPIGHIQFQLPDTKIHIYSDTKLAHPPQVLLALKSTYDANEEMREIYPAHFELISSIYLLKQDYDSTPYS